MQSERFPRGRGGMGLMGAANWARPTGSEFEWTLGTTDGRGHVLDFATFRSAVDM